MPDYSGYHAPFQAPREPLWSFPAQDKLPHNIEAEQALLGAMFLSVDACLKVFTLIEPEDFYEPLHQRIYTAILSQVQDGRTPTPITLKPFFQFEEKLGDITVHQYMGRLVVQATTVVNARDYAEAVKDCAQRRKMAAVAERMMDAVYGVTASPADSAIETIGELDGIVASMRPERDRRMTLYAAAHKAIDDAKAGKGMGGVTTGLTDLDRLIGGLPKPGYTVIGARPSMGKAQPLDAKVLLRDGSWKVFADLRLGDDLASIDGAPSRVSGIYPQGLKQIYRVTFSDGRTTECCAEHLWAVHFRKWAKPKTLKTTELIALLEIPQYRHRLWIDQPSGHFGQKTHLPLEPWLLGAWLGNGCTGAEGFLISTPFEETVQEMRAAVGDGLGVRPSGYLGWKVTAGRTGGQKNPAIEALRKLKLYQVQSHDRFIPSEYMRAGRDCRLALLQGLLDTDGWIEKWGSVRFCTTSEALANDIVALARSLGCWAKKNSKAKTAYTHAGEKRNGRKAYVVNLAGSIPFFRLPAKAARQVVRQRQKHPVLLSIVPSRLAEAACISVTHPGRLYVTDDYVVTHNSIMACHLALRAARKGSGVLLFSLEMEGGIVAMRNLSDAVWNQQTPVPIDSINRWKQPEQEDRLRRAADSFEALPLRIDATPGLTAAEITARCRQTAALFEKQGKSLDLILIDHLGKMKASSRYAGQKVNETGEKSDALATLTKLTGAAVCAFSQLNRQTENRDDKRPTLADLRDTGDLEQDADLVAFLYRGAYYLDRMRFDDEEDEKIRKERLAAEKNVLEIIIAKNRNGPCDTVNAFIDISNNVVRDAATLPYRASSHP